jgi:hypothetical protein
MKILIKHAAIITVDPRVPKQLAGRSTTYNASDSLQLAFFNKKSAETIFSEASIQAFDEEVKLEATALLLRL